MLMPGWQADHITAPKTVLISESELKTYDGSGLLEPQKFLYDALHARKSSLVVFRHQNRIQINEFLDLPMKRSH